MTIGRSPLATSSLGAVGGARGTAAGGLRILIEFLTQYDSASVKELERDLADLDKQVDAATRKQLSAAKAVETSEQKANHLANERKRIVATLATKPSAVNAELRQIQNIGVLSRLGQQRLKDLDKELGARGRLLRTVTQEANIHRGMNGLKRNELRTTEILAEVEKQRVGVQRQLSAFQNLRSSVLPRLGGLAVGAVGGIFGGALIGVGFAAAQAALDAVEQGLLDLVDPSRHAREAIEEIGKAIESLSEGGDREQGAIRFLQSLGITADKTLVSILAEAAADQAGRENLEARKKLNEIILHQEELKSKVLEDQIDLILKERGLDRGRLETARARTRGRVDILTEVTAEAERRLAAAQRAAADEAQRAATEAYNLEQARKAQTAATQLAAFAEQQLVSAIKAGSQGRLNQFDLDIQKVQDNAGPSKRTLALEAQIEKLNNAANGTGKNRELANIAEERALILLRQRLRLMGTAIDLEKFEGKFLLEAINAKLKALQKEAAAQERLNKLLDLQFRASQTLRRNEGEAIGDFVERRAQENRDILSEQRDLEREAVEERLRELQEKTQDEVALSELAERKKNAAASAGSSARLKALQKELAASKQADADATRAKIAAIQKQKDAYEQLRDDAIEFSTELKNEQIRQAISAAKTVTDLQKISGQIAGLTAAKSFISSLLLSGAVTGPEAKRLQEALARINSTLSQNSAKLHNVVTKHAVGRGPLEYKEGGLVPLNNASSPFGSNVRLGEEGTEFGLVLQHSIAKTLRNQGRVGQIGPFNVSRSDDMLRDNYNLKRAVQEAVREALQ